MSGVWKLTILDRYTMLAQRDHVEALVSVLRIRCILYACIPADNMQRSGSVYLLEPQHVRSGVWFSKLVGVEVDNKVFALLHVELAFGT